LGDWEEKYVFADRQRVQQVLLNLISNAVKYNREGGWVTVSCEERQGAVRICVRDTGAGISPENLAKLFRPFERLGAADTNIQGTGLGLACSKAFVEAMDGVIGVESVAGSGSVFWFELPQAARPDGEIELQAEADSCPAAITAVSGKILYVEDNAANLSLVRRVLARFPQIEFLSAARAAEGVRMARGEMPDVILMDLHLPDFWGDEALRRLRADPATRTIPVVMLSADATPGQIEALLAQGAHSYLTKPLDCDKLVETIGAILGNEVPAHAG
jgi:CheY-like chemotaxis protein